ncbi:MAG: hypothetical protein WC319_05615 [Candidatus Paceibacterota bacterium]|jgi:hypothetical protein
MVKTRHPIKLPEKKTDSRAEFLSKNRMAGGYLPPALSERFSIYSVYKGVSRSQLIHTLIERELTDPELPSFSEMIDDIARRYLVLKADNVSMARYKLIISSQLDRKKLSLEQIKSIVDRMEEIANGESSTKKESNSK